MPSLAKSLRRERSRNKNPRARVPEGDTEYEVGRAMDRTERLALDRMIRNANTGRYNIWEDEDDE